MPKPTKRSFEPLLVTVAGAQLASNRFGGRHHDIDQDTGPPVSSWRCNLTGLSQTHNLYFVAFVDDIYVYEPQFPAQTLPEAPSLIVPSTPSRPDLRGYLDGRNPHAINNLVVQSLGSDEVVATVRDDGDLDVVLVRHILQAIDRRAEPGNALEPKATELRPIFQSNVGKSAWGLAIHAQARIIATSANTHNITIFKFGLIDADEAASHYSAQRGTDVIQTVLNGNSNIPYIAFCNTGDDPSGRWLLTTDISGFCRTIDLHAMTTAQVFRFGPPMIDATLNTMDPINPGWAITFLDRRSFLPETSFHAALGLAHNEQLPGGVHESSSVWDISNTVSHVADRAERFSMQKPRRHRNRLSSPHNDDNSPELPSLSSTVVDSDSDEASNSLSSAPRDGDENEDAQEDHSDSDSSSGEYVASVDLDDEGTEDSLSFEVFYGGRRIFGNAPQFYKPDPLCADLPCPILHASLRNAYILQPSAALHLAPHPHRGYTTRAPTIGFANALHQHISLPDSYLNVFERMNMLVAIPSLGVVVLASQKGRAAVLSLTLLPRATALTFPPHCRSSALAPASEAIYAMRIDHILPFAHQEAARQRPAMPLLGLAASPVQGTQHLPAHEQTRWRLFLTYADHSVLSYEIRSRQRASAYEKRSRDSGVDTQDLVV